MPFQSARLRKRLATACEPTSVRTLTCVNTKMDLQRRSTLERLATSSEQTREATVANAQTNHTPVASHTRVLRNNDRITTRNKQSHHHLTKLHLTRRRRCRQHKSEQSISKQKISMSPNARHNSNSKEWINKQSHKLTFPTHSLPLRCPMSTDSIEPPTDQEHLPQ